MLMWRFYLSLGLLVVVSVLILLTFIVWAPIHTPQYYFVLGVLAILGYMLSMLSKKGKKKQ